MTPPPSLLALDPHLILLGPPPAQLRRDTPARPVPANPDPGVVKAKADGICPSHAKADTFWPKPAERTNAASLAKALPHAEAETEQAREAAEGWEPEGWTEDGRTWGEMDADEGAETDAEPPAPCARCCGTGQEIDLSSGELRDCRACHGTGSEIDLSEADPTCPYCGRPGLAARGGICADCYPGAEGPEDEDCENPEDWQDEDCENPEDWQDEDWTGHPDLGAGALRADDPAACSACRGSGQELRADGSGELDSCEDCGGTGLAEPWRDPDYAVARLLNELYEEAWGSGDDPDPDWAPTCRACACGDSSFPLPRCRCACHGDPDPGDGGLGLPPLQAQGWAAEVEAEACPGCGRPSPHLYAGATCAGCLVGRAA